MAKGSALVIGNITGYEHTPAFSQWSPLFKGTEDILYESGTAAGEWAVRLAAYLGRKAVAATRKDNLLPSCALVLILCSELTDELLEVYGRAAAYDVERIIFGAREKPSLL